MKVLRKTQSSEQHQMKKLAIALLLAGLLMMLLSAEVFACGKRSFGRATRVANVEVRADIQLPSFYLRGEGNEILFFRRDEVLNRVAQRAGEYRKQGLEQAAMRSELLLKEIESSKPFDDYDDLFGYSLRTPDLGLEIRALAADLLSEGKATVVQRRLTETIGKSITSIQLYFQLNQQNDPVAKWFCTPTGSSLLRITYFVD